MNTIEQADIKEAMQLIKIDKETKEFLDAPLETPLKKQKKALILRMGGVGDTVILTVVAKQLHKRGFLVDYFVGSPVGNVAQLFENLPYLNSCKDTRRVNGVDCVEDEDKNWIAISIIKEQYDEVYDYKNSIEMNATGFNKPEGWRTTINSNYVNWVDHSLAWANIDWTTVFDEDKVPEIGFKDEKYLEWFETTGLTKKEGRTNHRIIGIQLSASSLVRTFYRANDLPALLHEQFPDDIILIFDRNSWFALTKFGKRKIDFDEELNPLLQSVQILRNLDVFICADTGFGHIAAACKIKTVSLYTSVPSWTRAKYYKDQVSVDAQAECRPCFTLDGVCPIRKREAWEALTERERDLINSSNANMNIFEVAKKYNTIPQSIQKEFSSAKGKLDALTTQMPACVESVTTDKIIEAVKEVVL